MSELKDFSLENIIVTAVKIPGVKVDRKKFLCEIFSDDAAELQNILDNGTIAAGISRERLMKIANKLIVKRTSESSAASFVVGIPGGLALPATISADIIQFFGISLRIAQEISYLYGADDLWENGEIDFEKVKSQLILYCGVMFGVSGAVSGVRVLSAQLAKTSLKKIPQKALMKTFWYPMLKQIGKAIGVKVTKQTLAKGVSKAIPVLGGVLSGAINFASMMPMAKRLLVTLDKANFDYTEAEFEADIVEIESVDDEEAETERERDIETINEVKDKLSKGLKDITTSVQKTVKNTLDNPIEDCDIIIEKIEKLSKLKDSGILTAEEFEEKKTELLAKI